MRKLIVTLLLAALLVSMAGYASAASVTVHITGHCNVRYGPSLDDGIMGTASEGTTLKGTGNSSKDDRGVVWYQVNYHGEKGWVSSKYAYTTGSGGGGGGGSSTRYVIGDTGKSNVHTGPGLSYKVIGVLRVDDSAKYLEETSVDRGDKKEITVKLENMPKRPRATTRLRIRLRMIAADRMLLEVQDMGFGEIFPSSGMKWEQEIDING